MNSRIFRGEVIHARQLNYKRAFRVPVPLVWIDLAELPELDQRYPWFGHNRARLWSVRDTDYLDPTPQPIRAKLESFLRARDIEWTPDTRVMLLTGPRYFNYVFNPVSFYLGYDPADRLVFAVAEVNNTFKEKHLYALDARDQVPGADGYRFTRDKAFHVSPFMDLAGQYHFRFAFPENGLDITVDLRKTERPAFHARLHGNFWPFHTTYFARTLWRYPLAGLLTMGRIIMEAIKLYMRGAPVYERPTPVHADTVGRRAVGRVPWTVRWVWPALAGIKRGRLAVTLPDGTHHQFGDGASEHGIEWHIKDWRVFNKLLWDGDIGLGESYMAGDWTTNDLTGFVRLLLDNRAALEKVDGGSWWRRLAHRLLAWKRRNSVLGSRRNIAAHYDLSNDMFATFLDEHMAYSAAVFETPDQSLVDAQVNKFERLCRKADVQDGDHVLEIGCGWGGFACYVARYADCRVTAITISQAQYEAAVARVEREGLTDRVTVRLQDYRSLSGTYDKIISIEMFEAVGYEYYGTFFSAVERLLKPDGVFVMQAISIPDQRFDRYRKSYDWIRKYIFPGGLLPSLEVIQQHVRRYSRFVVQDVENIGTHYATTLRHWSERFNARLDAIREQGFDVRFERMWNFYLSYCEAAFAAQYLGNLQIVCARPGRATPVPRV